MARKLRQQEEAIAGLEAKAVALREKGDAVYGHWQELEELLKNIENWREKGESYDEINKKLAGKAVINKKTHKLTVKL